MRKILVTILTLVLVLAVTACETSFKYKLSFEDTVLATNVDGTWEKADGNTFSSGTKIGIVFIDVSGFEKNEEGLNHMDIDVEVKDSEGETLMDQKGLLGESGIVDMENNIASSPVGSLNTDGLEAGKYTLKVTVHDKVGGGRVQASKSFKIE